MTIKYFSHTQTSAPVCAGTAGYLNDLLYACLVTGYNTKTVSTLSITSNVATLETTTTHNYVAGDVINIYDANETLFNNDFVVLTTPTSTSLTFNLVGSDQSATGTISVKISPLGWTREFTGTNKAIYRAPAGNRGFLRIDDSNAQYATVAGYENATGIDSTLTNIMGSLYWQKSSTANTTAREWYLFGTDKVFYLFIAWHASYLTSLATFAFGDILSVKDGDTFGYMLTGNTATAPSYPASNNNFAYANSVAYYNGLLFQRNSLGQVGATNFTKYTIIPTSTNVMGVSICPFPNPSDIGLHLVPIYCFDYLASTFVSLRGRLPGIFCAIENVKDVFNSNDRTITISNKTYVPIRIADSGTNRGMCFIDITGPWE
jgi:hypothetical protein